MRLKQLFIFWIVFWAGVVFHTAQASHIVGSDLTYRCLGPGPGNTARYEITLILYQDCLSGAPTAITEDNPAYIGIYNANTGGLFMIDSIYSQPFQIIPPNFNNNCVNNAPNTCLRKETFIKSYNLPNDQPFHIVYQRCCRNSTVLNLLNPGAVGATYYCLIPPATTGCNNSARFWNSPPQIICINNPLVYDHSAIDSDADSLSYEFCQTYVGGTQTDAKPLPPPPPYQPVTYIGGFSSNNPMGGNPPLQIDPKTGLITGTPNIAGRYVVTVCCHEWRNGVIINTVTREFQFVVTNCSKAVVADIPQYSDEPNTYIVECNSMTVKFDNHSTGGFSYLWDFGVPGMVDDTSDAFEPSFTYPDTGTYVVKLWVNRGSTCPDSISRIVKVYPTFHSVFTYDGLHCPMSELQFIDGSSGTSGDPISWLWTFGDGNYSSERNPVHRYDTGNVYTVTLETKNGRGCKSIYSEEIFIENFKPFAGNDTIIVKGEQIHFDAKGGGQYTWFPSDRLNNPYIGNPTGYFPDTGRFHYMVHVISPHQCEGVDSIFVWVVNNSSLFVPTAFTPNGDGLNDFLKPIGVGYSKVRFFRVFNRWGELVYQTEHFKQGWNGEYNGVPAEVGVYFWVLGVVDRFGKEELIKGDAVLIR